MSNVLYNFKNLTYYIACSIFISPFCVYRTGWCNRSVFFIDVFPQTPLTGRRTGSIVQGDTWPCVSASGSVADPDNFAPDPNPAFKIPGPDPA